MSLTDPATNLRQPPARDGLVSIVVPTYNRAKYLPEAVESALAQTWTDLEVVIVDDGSRDNTRDVVAALAAKDQRVRYFAQPNGGVSSARNHALARCQGSLIAFLDSDDVWLPGKLAAQVAILRALPQACMVWSDMHTINLEGEHQHDTYLRTMYRAWRRRDAEQAFSGVSTLSAIAPGSHPEWGSAPVKWGNLYSQMMYGNLVHTSTVLLRREAAAGVGGFDESMKAGGEDYKFHLSTSRMGQIALLDLPTIKYRIGAEDRITSPKNQINFATSFLRTIDEQVAAHREMIHLNDRQLRAIRGGAHDWLASALVEAGNKRNAATHALNALQVKPSSISAWKTLAKSLLPNSAVQLVRTARRITTGSTTASMSIFP